MAGSESGEVVPPGSGVVRSGRSSADINKGNSDGIK